MNLQVGDKAIMHFGGGFQSKVIVTIDKVTPTGWIRVKEYPNVKFGKDGWEKGGDIWNHKYLEEYTKEAEEEINNNMVISKAYYLMRDIKREDISVDQAKEIIKILRGDNE